MGGIAAIYELGRNLVPYGAHPDTMAIIGWVLAIVFLLSGTSKLLHPALTAMAIVDFGVANRVRPWLGVVFGGAELTLAAGLVVAATPYSGSSIARVSAVAVASILWLFVALIARSLLLGADFDCHCFGPSGSRLSKFTLYRTLTFAILASWLATIEVHSSNVYSRSGLLMPIVAAVSAVSTSLLLTSMPNLVRWNRDYYQEFGRRVTNGRN